MDNENEEFEVGDSVTFRESQGPYPETGVVSEVIPADDQYPMGGLYIVELDNDKGGVEAFWTELTKND